jgi:hypothetical protein
MREFLNEFFSNGNKRSAMVTGCPENTKLHFKKMIEPVVHGQLPAILPRRDAGLQFWFYVLSKNSNQLNEIIQMIRAYLGGTYIQFDPVEYTSSDDPIEQALLKVCPHGFIRMCIPLACPSSNIDWVMDSLNCLIQQYHDRPLILSTVKRPVGIILRNFFTACRHYKGHEAQKYYQELKAQQGLSPRNLLSLEIQALEADNKWRMILQHPKLPDILAGRVPLRLQLLLLRTLKQVYLGSSDPQCYHSEKLKEQLQPYHTLFFVVPDIEADACFIDEWQSWAIGAACLGYAKVAQALPAVVAKPWIEELYKWAELPYINSEQSLIPSCDNLLMATPAQEVAIQLLKESTTANYELGKFIFNRLHEYSNEIIQPLLDLDAFRRLWSNLEVEYGEHSEISNWSQMFRFLESNCSASDARGALKLVIERVDHWTAADWQPESLHSALEKISDSVSAEVLRDLLPLFLGWLERHQLNLDNESIEHLLLLLVMDEQHSVEDLTLCSDLVQMLLQQPHSTEHYQTMVEAVSTCWDKVKSMQALDGCFELIEGLLDGPCADENVRFKFWNRLQVFLIQYWLRVPTEQKMLSRDLAMALLGNAEHFPENTAGREMPEQQAVDLSGKKLALYTLTEGSARRAAFILSSFYPGLEICVNHDKSATSALKNLIVSADYFVFASRSAAHQAFYAITNQRKDLIYPQGKGSSSIVRCFLEFTESELGESQSEN